jgi:Leucine-rich repeat (LRR) protein
MELSELSELRMLDLSNNELADIPYALLGKLQNLRELILSNNPSSSTLDMQNTISATLKALLPKCNIRF